MGRAMLPVLLLWATLAAPVAGQEGDATCPAGTPGCGMGHKPGEYFWPMQKGDQNRTGKSPYPQVTDFSMGPTWVWRDPYLDVIRDTPLIDDQKNIYLGTEGGRMYKFNTDGALLWSYLSERGNTPTVAAIMDGSVYLNTNQGNVVALDMETGKERWVVKLSDGIAGDTACMFAFNGTVISAAMKPNYVGNNNMVVALSTDGSVKWRFIHEWPSFNFQASSPGDGTLIFQDHFGGVYRLEMETGKLLWESGVRDRMPWFFSTGAAVAGPNGIVYAASNYHNNMGIIHAYRLSDGAPLWRKEMGMPVNQAIAYGKLTGSTRDSVVAGVGENPGYPFVMTLPQWLPITERMKGWVNSWSVAWAGRPTWLWGTKELLAAIVALDAETGDTRWKYTPPPFTRPSCEGDEANLPARFMAAILDPAHPKDNICLPDNWAQAVIGGDGTTYVGHQDGKLYAVRDANGNGQIEEREVSSYYFGHAFQASQAMAPGMLAVAPCGGGLYVWKS